MDKQYIQLQEANCRNCMRCVRICPTKAMTYVDYQPVIKTEECILCGQCYLVCPHDAKRVFSDLAKVKRWLKDGEKVVVSLAPSFASVWPNLVGLKKSLLKLGFYDVQETAVGANIVSQEYTKLIKEKKMKNIITTCCSSVVYLVEKYYPELVDQLAPVVSPMIAHGMKIKDDFPGCKVVFITPCIAKQKEADEKKYEGIVDATITMGDFNDYLQGNFKDELIADEKWDNIEGEISRMYPTPGGIIETLSTELSNEYYLINVEGSERIKRTLESIRNGELEGYFIEMSECDNSCLGGPLLSHFNHNEWTARSAIYNNVNLDDKVVVLDEKLDYFGNYKGENLIKFDYTNDQIKDILYLMGKTSKEKELNCGMCGYETCREKAIAVLDGKADPKICLPNALEKAQSISNIIIENTPNGIIVLDKNNNVQEINPAAIHLLNLDDINPKGFPLIAVLPSDELEKEINETQKVQYVEHTYDHLGVTIEHAIMKLAGSEIVILILMDITVNIAKDRIIKEMKQQTFKITQDVIDNQMRTVQEIASLLGETTAKSKVALTRLMKVIEEDEK
jgi:iron only hydrogenase large subunit-like protein